MYRITVAPGVRCAVEDVNTCGRSAILFVHGWPLSQEIFDCQYDILPQYGIRCIGMDLRGFGDSDKPWQGYSYDQLADDLHQVIESLPCSCVTLCGFSMGAAVCVRYMSRYRGRSVEKLVLCGGACPSFVQQPGYPYGMSRDQVDRLIDLGYDNRPQLCSEFSRMCFAQDPGDAYLDWIRDICLQAPGRSVIQACESLRDEDLRQDLGAIRVPTAILHGRLDRVCPFPFAGEMNRGIPNSFVVPFEQSGHCLFYEERDKFNSCLIDFINS